MKKRQAITIISTLLLILWVYAAGSKLAEYKVFTEQLARQPLPHWSISFLSIGLPLVELIAVVLLSFQRTRGKGFLLSLILLVAFTIYVGLGLAHIYDKMPCSCGGILGNMGWGVHLLFNIFFTLLAFIGGYLHHKNNLNIHS